jgi:two-component system cell cycle sensor histidine kinase/response regulator CckA
VLDFEVVNLNDVIVGVQAMLQAAVGDQVRVVTRLDPELTNVRADAHELEQVLLNLAVNARDAMPTGGSLLIETDRVVLGGDHLDPHLGTRSGPHVLLTVTDTGTGMDEATQARIFEPFFTTKAPGRGTGLGLSSAYGVVQQFGGHLSVYSEPGHGTCFRIYLPEHQGPAERDRTPDRAPAPLLRPVTVLLVDDDPAVRRAVARLLAGSDLRVLEADGPEEAVHLSERHEGPIDLVLSDVAMAGLDGIRLVDRLRTRRAETRVLLMSGYTQEAITRLGKPALAYPLLVKPFTKAGLLDAIRSALGQESADGVRGPDLVAPLA